MTASEMVANLQRQRFYGSVELKFEAGHIVLIRKTENIKIVPNNFRAPRGEHAEIESL